jgi:hypothetical protein
VPTHSYTNAKQFPQAEGFTQGCPLSGAFADIVLTLVLEPINQQLQQRIQQRSPHEHVPTTLSYHDDTNVVIPYPDITWFLSTFQTLGAPLGIKLNLDKTQILTSLTAQPPNLTAQDFQHFQTILQVLGPHAEQREGIRLLGQPIGSAAFATTYISQQTACLHHIVTQQLLHRIQDHQTQLAILKHCAIPSIVHLLAAHLYHHHTPTLPNTLFHWDSEITLAIRISIHHAIATITQQMTLPHHTLSIIHLPATLGGIGIRDPSTAIIPAYITSITRSLRYATHGITIGSTTHNIAPIHAFALQQDRHTQILQHYAPTFLPLLPQITTKNPTAPTLQQFITQTPLQGLQRHFYHLHQKTIHDNFTQYSPPDLHPLLPSLLTPLTSLPLVSMSRRIPTNRFLNDEFRLLLQRKLRLPIFSPSLHPQQCTCRSKPILDPFGDHLFSCTAASKTPIHNYIRDTLYHILAKIGPLANIVRSPTDVSIEPPTLLPGLPTLRPADIGLQLLPSPKYKTTHTHNPYLAIDVTFTHVPSIEPTSHDAPTHVPPVSNATHQVHDDSAKMKYNVPHAHQLYCQNISLLPFTVDHLGGIGHIATQFLFGDSIPSSSLPPQWIQNSFRTNPAAYTLLLHSTKNTPHAVLQKANHQWHSGTSPPTRFGRTYHTYTPSQWATQALALNLSKALTHHLLLHTNRILTQTTHQRKTQRQTQYTTIPPFYLPPPPFLNPSETTIDLPTATTPTSHS